MVIRFALTLSNCLSYCLTNISVYFQNKTFSILIISSLFALTGASLREQTTCWNQFCITLPEGEIIAEAGLCVVIPCYFITRTDFIPQHIIWSKCQRNCYNSETIFNSDNSKISQSGFVGRVSLLVPDVHPNNCSIIINDLSGSDSGSYRLRVTGTMFGNPDRFTFSSTATVAVRGRMS